MQGVKGLCPALGQTVHSTSCRNRCRGPVTVRAEDKPELLPKPTLSPKPQRRPAPQQQRQAPARDVQQYKQPPQDGNGNGVGRQQGKAGVSTEPTPSSASPATVAGGEILTLSSSNDRTVGQQMVVSTGVVQVSYPGRPTRAVTVVCRGCLQCLLV